jgi:hypothetical protein
MCVGQGKKRPSPLEGEGLVDGLDRTGRPACRPLRLTMLFDITEGRTAVRPNR